jgi:acetyltransferase-like isoleucine patch superfamily enzyme
MNKGFLKEIRSDLEKGGVFSNLSSELKIRFYRQNGAIIEDDVSIGSGSVLLADKIHIGQSVTIGNNCRFECDDIRIGKMVKFIGDSEIVGRRVNIGDVSYFEKSVLIGLGGAKGPNSKIEIGKMCFIGMECQLNTSEPIFVGDETCIGVRTVLLTHSAWQNPLEGYPVRFGPISIGNNVWIGTDCFVLPGVRIENDVTVAPKSVVTNDIKQKGLYGGCPAKCIKDSLHHGVPLSEREKDRYVRSFVAELKVLLNFHSYSLINEESDEQIRLGFEKSGEKYVFLYSFDLDQELFKEIQCKDTSRKIVIFIKSDLRINRRFDNCSIFDLTNQVVSGVEDSFSNEIRNFFRRRGIRFRPIIWRYGEKND